jgi:hypothetical protein
MNVFRDQDGEGARSGLAWRDDDTRERTAALSARRSSGVLCGR